MKDLKAGSYKISKFCMEPTAFKVKEESQFANKEPEFVKTKLMTRLTYTLDEVSHGSARRASAAAFARFTSRSCSICASLSPTACFCR